MYGIYFEGKLKERFNAPIEAYEAAIHAYKQTGIFHEVRFAPSSTDFQEGDKVRHKEKPYFGTGTITGISKSGKRVYVRWGNDWDRKRLLMDPYSGYFPPEKLEKLT